MASAAIKHYGRVSNGKKIYYNPERYKQQIEALNGKEFVEIIEPKHERRTISQNSYYRGVILEACLKSEWFAHYDTKEDIHEEVFEKKFLKYVIERQVGDKKYNVTKYKSTANLSKEEFSEFINKVLVWCSEHEILVLDPSEYFLKK